MYTNKYFTSYYPVESGVHRLNSVVKLVCLLLLLIPIFASSSLKLHIVIAFFTIMLLYLSKVPLRFYFDSVYGLRYVYILLVLLLAAKGLYLENAVVLLIKITSLMLYLSMIFYTTSPSELKYGLEKVLTPFNLFNINISPAINKLVGIITFFPVLFATEKEVLINASSRGLDYFHTDILSRIYALALSFKNTLRLTKEKIAKRNFVMTLRGYSTKKHRTNLRTNKPGFFDILIILVHLIFVFYYIWEKGLL